MTRTIRVTVDATIDEYGTIQLLRGSPLEGERIADLRPASTPPTDLGEIAVHFTHPRDASIFSAIVSPLCTGERALLGLLRGNEQGPFLEPPPIEYPYEFWIKRTAHSINARTMFAEAGVADGDVIEVRQAGQGAGPPWDAIQLSLAYGVGTGVGVAFFKALMPILQQIVKNKGSQSLELQVAGKVIKSVGKNLSIKELLAAMKELAEMEPRNDSSDSRVTRRVQAKGQARQRKLKSIKRKEAKPGLPGTGGTRSPRLGTSKATKKAARDKKKSKKAS